MSAFDWFELGFGSNNVELANFKGAFGVTIGDVLKGTFGANHSHTFGPNISMCCDVEDLILGRFERFLPVLSGLIAGIGGNVKFVTASDNTFVYQGPRFDITRAKSVKRFGPPLFYDRPDIHDPQQAADPIDDVSRKLIMALVIVTCLIAAIMELIIHFKYPDFGSTNQADEDTIDAYGAVPKVLRVLSFTLTARLMALIRMIEEKGSAADVAREFLKDGKKVLLVAAAILVIACPLLASPWCLYQLERMSRDTTSAIANAQAALP